MNIACPTCGGDIALSDVNVSTDVALCRRCEKNFSYAELCASQNLALVDLRRPPKGAWFLESTRGFEVGATTRSAIALFLVPFMVLWSGGSLGGIYGTQLMKGEFDPEASLFGVPFLIGTLVLGSVALMAVAGKIVLRVEGDDGALFTGVGPIGWTRRFNWREMRSVRTTVSTGSRGATRERITLEGQQRIDFGLGITSERRHFIEACIRQALAKKRR